MKKVMLDICFDNEDCNVLKISIIDPNHIILYKDEVKELIEKLSELYNEMRAE